MKKILALAALTACTYMAGAQNISFGVKAGVQNNILAITNEGTDEDTRVAVTGVGGHLAGIVDIGISPNFSIQPNLLFQYKGVKTGDTKFSLINADIPVNFLYKQGGFFVGGGPNISFGLSAKQQEDGEDDIDLYEDPEGDAEASLKRIEIGANVLMGYRFASGLTLSAHYTPGLTDLVKDSDANAKFNTRVYGFSIGYMFGK